MSKLETEEGVIEMEISEENRKFVEGLEGYTVGVTETYNGLRNDVKEVLKNLEDITLNVYKVANGFAEMQEKYSALIDASPKFEVVRGIIQNQTFS